VSVLISLFFLFAWTHDCGWLFLLIVFVIAFSAAGFLLLLVAINRFAISRAA
jgi:hypothetical protein